MLKRIFKNSMNQRKDAREKEKTNFFEDPIIKDILNDKETQLMIEDITRMLSPAVKINDKITEYIFIKYLAWTVGLPVEKGADRHSLFKHGLQTARASLENFSMYHPTRWGINMSLEELSQDQHKIALSLLIATLMHDVGKTYFMKIHIKRGSEFIPWHPTHGNLLLNIKKSGIDTISEDNFSAVFDASYTNIELDCLYKSLLFLKEFITVECMTLLGNKYFNYIPEAILYSTDSKVNINYNPLINYFVHNSRKSQSDADDTLPKFRDIFIKSIIAFIDGIKESINEPHKNLVLVPGNGGASFYITPEQLFNVLSAYSSKNKISFNHSRQDMLSLLSSLNFVNTKWTGTEHSPKMNLRFKYPNNLLSTKREFVIINISSFIPQEILDNISEAPEIISDNL